MELVLWDAECKRGTIFGRCGKARGVLRRELREVISPEDHTSDSGRLIEDCLK